MKPVRFVVATLATAVCTAWGIAAFACDKHQGTQASAASTSGTCNAKMAAACKAKSAAGVSAQAGACPMHATTAVAAGASGACGNHGASTASADKASGHCGDKAALSAGAGQCNGRGMARFSGAAQHPECDACADMAECEAELSAAGAQTQVVPLRNGVMFVYTANSPGAVNAVQAAVARRGARLLQFQTAGDKARLCADCKSMRGAAASGRLTREVVNIEGGALTLMTSDDPKVVAKIRAMMDRTAARAKI